MHAPRPPTIMLVDDEPQILMTLKVGIERGMPGARVVIETNPRSALARLVREGVDVIMSDQRMPEMEGIDLLIEARRISPTSHRIMMTGYADGRLLERDINEARISHFFSKPFRLAEVVGVLRKLQAEDEARAEAARELAKAFASRPERVGGPLKTIPEPLRGPLS